MIKPLRTGTAHILPFNRLSALDFERLCLWLIAAEGFRRPEHYGLSGSDGGRDIVAWRNGEADDELWYFQCKRRDRVGASELGGEIDKLTTHAWHGYENVRHLVFLTTCSLSGRTRDRVRKHALQNGISCVFWAESELDYYVKLHGNIVHEFFGSISADEAPLWVRRRVDERPIAEAQDALRALASSVTDQEAAPAAGSRVPYPANPCFTGRSNELARLRELFGTSLADSAHRVVVFCGMPGVGKTQTATEFIHRFGGHFVGGVFWLDASDPAMIASEVATCAGSRFLDLGLGVEQLPIESRVDAVLAAWNARGPVLIVLDNCEDDSALRSWISRIAGARILVTARHADWDPVSPFCTVKLLPLARVDSLRLLCKYLPPESTQPATTAMGDIAEALGDLPLALHLAGSYMQRYRHRITPSEYAKSVTQDDLLAHRSFAADAPPITRSPTGHTQHIGRTLDLALAALDPADTQDRLARRLLACTVNLVPGLPIERSFFQAFSDWDADADAARSEDEDEFSHAVEDALKRLESLGLVDELSDGAIRYHRLVGLAARVALQDSAASADVESVCLASMTMWTHMEVGMPFASMNAHFRCIVERAFAEASPNRFDLATLLGTQLRLIGDFNGAVHWLTRVVSSPTQETNGLPCLGHAWNHLGIIARQQRRPEDAERCYAAAIAVVANGDDVPGFAFAMASNRGYLLCELERYDEAREEWDRALQMAEQDFADDPVRLSQAFHNAGLARQFLGDLDAAERCYERALTLRRPLGERFWRTAATIDCLASIHKARGDTAEARRLFKEALRIELATLGALHPDTAQTMARLGRLELESSEYEVATATLSEAFAALETSLGSRHPATLDAAAALAFCLARLCRWREASQRLEWLLQIEVAPKEFPLTEIVAALVGLESDLHAHDPGLAEAFYVRALQIIDAGGLQRSLSDATVSVMFARLLILRERPREAIRFFERALSVSLSQFGESHEISGFHHEWLGQALLASGDRERAVRHLEAALATREIATSSSATDGNLLNSLATAYREQNKFHVAISLYSKALRICERAEGARSLNYIVGLNNLAATARRAGKLRATRPLLEVALALAAEHDDKGQLTALTLQNFGALLHAEGDVENAAAALWRAQALWCTELGRHHISTRLCRASFNAVAKDLPPSSLKPAALELDENVLTVDTRLLDECRQRFQAELSVASEHVDSTVRRNAAASLDALADTIDADQLAGSPRLQLACDIRAAAGRLRQLT